MRIYCDSNIFRKSRKNSSQFNESVYDSLECLKESFIFLFSEGHLFDLEKSQESYRIEDLLHMETYVKNNYLYRDPIKKSFHYYLATPSEAYESIDFKEIDKFFEDPHKYFDSMFDFEGGEVIGKIVKSYFDLPLFEPLTEPDNSDPAIKEAFDSFKGVRSINDALKKFTNFNRVLDSKKEYKKYKKLVSRYINRDEYSFEKWSYDFNERMKETVFSKSFTEMVDMTINESDKSDDYNYFIRTYTQLEFYGVTEERKGKKKQLKANSYWDIHKDATHAYYASKADYLVSDDNGLLTKAFITYHLLGIDTQVLSVNDLIEKSPNLIKNEPSLDTFYDTVTKTILEGEVINEQFQDNIRLLKPPYNIFNYFNRLQTSIFPDYFSLQLFKSENVNRDIMYAEIAMFIKKLTALFGDDLGAKKLDDLKLFSQYENGEPINIWRHGNQVITLSYEENTLKSRIICLSILFPKMTVKSTNRMGRRINNLSKNLRNRFHKWFFHLKRI